MYNTENFKKEFEKLSIYRKFPQMVPFVGSQFEKQKSRLLVIGESFYLPTGCSMHLTDKWYDESTTIEDFENQTPEKENEEPEFWIDTVGAIHKKSATIYRNIENAIKESGFNPQGCENIFQYIAFYNYFLRPAEVQGKSINVTEKDKTEAIGNFFKILEILNPDYVIFTSAKAWKAFDSSKRVIPNKDGDYVYNDKITFENTSHPGSQWWNTKCEKYRIHENGNVREATGKEYFINVLTHYKIFQ